MCVRVCDKVKSFKRMLLYVADDLQQRAHDAAVADAADDGAANERESLLTSFVIDNNNDDDDDDDDVMMRIIFVTDLSLSVKFQGRPQSTNTISNKQSVLSNL